MKAVALHTQSRHFTRQSEGLSSGWLRVVKGSIETGDLWNIGLDPGNRPHRSEVMRLM